MKKFKYLGMAMLLAAAACTTSAVNSVAWQPDGRIANNSGQKKQLEITGIYDSLNYQGVTYLAGFKIDQEGINFPQLVSADNALSNINYWEFEKISSDIFAYQKSVHVVDTDGGVYHLENGSWRLTSTTFPPESQIVYSDNNADLVVCYPASPLKNVVRESGCKSLANNWKLDFVWVAITPKVCSGRLFAIEEKGDSSLIKKVDIKTGKVISSENFENPVDDICDL